MVLVFSKFVFIFLLLILLIGCGTQQKPPELKYSGVDFVSSGSLGPDPNQSENQDSAEAQVSSPQEVDFPTEESAVPGEALKSNLITGSDDYTMYDYLNFLLRDVHNFWKDGMVYGGYREPYVRFSFPSPEQLDEVTTACSEKLEPVEAFYCPSDDLIVITQEAAREIWLGEFGANPDSSKENTAGDFSVALVVAHEYAHSLQGELGWLEPVQMWEGGEYEELIDSAAKENNADCLAGVWANSTYHRDMLEEGDIEEAIRTLEDIGDVKIGSAKTHGTAEERYTAFFTGYDSGNPRNCDHYLMDAYNEKYGTTN